MDDGAADDRTDGHRGAAGVDDPDGDRTGGGDDAGGDRTDGGDDAGGDRTDAGDDAAPAYDLTGHVEAIFTAPEGSAPMERRESVRAVEGGLRGDRYCDGAGHFAPYDVCAVTLVSGAAIDRVREEFGIDVSDGRHRRNLVVRGIEVGELLSTTFRAGEALLRGTRRRPPCAHVERLAGEEGLARALKEGRGGICADVIRPGRIGEGDPVRVETPDPETAGRRIADRLRGTGEDG